MTTTYMTDDFWAQKKDYANFTAYAAKNPSPSAITLNTYRETAYSNMNRWTGGAQSITNWLRGVEYLAVEFQIDEEQARSTGQSSPQMMPRDYISKRDREGLQALNSSFNRGVGRSR